MHPPNFTVGDGYITILLRKQRDMYAFSVFSSVKCQFYIHFQNKYQLGGSSTRPLIGSAPLDPTG